MRSPGPSPHTHHPSQQQAGLTGCADGDAGGGHVWRCLQCLDDPGGRAEGSRPHHVHLLQTEPGGPQSQTPARAPLSRLG